MLGIRLYTWVMGELVGEDQFGNRYYIKRGQNKLSSQKRWVIYRGEDEASKVPAEWHGWLHHTFDLPETINGNSKWPWQKPHLPNLTGTELAYRPRPKASHESRGVYEAWSPKS